MHEIVEPSEGRMHRHVHGNGEGDVRTVFSVTKRSAAALAVFRYDVPAEFEVNEGPVLRVGLQDNASASSSVAPVRAALRDVFSPIEVHRASSAVA